MDPILVAGLTGFLTARGSAFLDAALSPIGEAIGEDVLARYRAWRARNQAAVVSSAAELQAATGDAPSMVPGRLLFPILEYASVEEDPGLRDKWAALLANSMSPSEAH